MPFHQTSPWDGSTDATVETTTNRQATSSTAEDTEKRCNAADSMAGCSWPDWRRYDDDDEWMDVELESFLENIRENNDPSLPSSDMSVLHSEKQVDSRMNLSGRVLHPEKNLQPPSSS